MKVIWSDFSSDILVKIYLYFKEKAGYTIAKRIKSQIFESTKQLIKHPISGQIEETLKHLGESHRYLLEGNYKIIYKQIEEGILITDVFDTRQDPIKINDKNRNPSSQLSRLPRQ